MQCHCTICYYLCISQWISYFQKKCEEEDQIQRRNISSFTSIVAFFRFLLFAQAVKLPSKSKYWPFLWGSRSLIPKDHLTLYVFSEIHIQRSSHPFHSIYKKVFWSCITLAHNSLILEMLTKLCTFHTTLIHFVVHTSCQNWCKKVFLLWVLWEKRGCLICTLYLMYQIITMSMSALSFSLKNRR